MSTFVCFNVPTDHSQLLVLAHDVLDAFIFGLGICCLSVCSEAFVLEAVLDEAGDCHDYDGGCDDIKAGYYFGLCHVVLVWFS